MVAAARSFPSGSPSTPTSSLHSVTASCKATSVWPGRPRRPCPAPRAGRKSTTGWWPISPSSPGKTRRPTLKGWATARPGGWRRTQARGRCWKGYRALDKQQPIRLYLTPSS
ncbi:unnamed protein product [Heterosigma akashiwo]